MRIVRRLTAALTTALTVLALAGCADFGVVKQFAGETTTLTAAAKQEIQQVFKLCGDYADTQALLDEATSPALAAAAQTGKGLQAKCRRAGSAAVAFQQATADTLDLYAAALLALVDDRHFDLRSAVESTGRKIDGLKTKDGTPIADAGKVGVLRKLFALISDAVAQRQREAGVRQLVEAGPALAENASSLREFFVRPDGKVSDYELLMSTAHGLHRDLRTDLAKTGPWAQREPLRAAELRLQMVPDEVFVARVRPAQGKDPAPVPARMAAGIDAWMALLPAFQKDALKPEAKALRATINAFRAKASEAHEASGAGF